MNFEAHPRSRGENGLTSAGTAVKAGSSPLTRGKHAIPAASATPMRLIPAHAGKTNPSFCPLMRGEAHPRSRGENGSACSIISVRSGSSPLTRGKHVAAASWSARSGLIPAHAGKTQTCPPDLDSFAAHPRSRGENYQYHLIRYQPSGSSPLTRGKPTHAACQGVGDRLIPAHAGKTLEAVGLHDLCPAHPRSRGENGQIISTRRPSAGSSPLTRGKQGAGDESPRDERLIPAHAGKTHPRC